jgi:hypothetical protein
MKGTRWTCPFCGHHQTLTDGKFDIREFGINVGENIYGELAYRLVTTGCSNPKCAKVQVEFTFGTAIVKAVGGHRRTFLNDVISTVQVLPESNAKPQPDFIPLALRNDYTEACRIKDLSPKASATLARRCLQGMIRNFCDITKGRLVDEIDTLREVAVAGKAPSGVTIESIDAIDHVRGIGNIGAHMEKDINLIIDVEPNEAQALIELIELLFEEWYIARETRQQRLKRVQEIAEDKTAAKAQPAAKAPASEFITAESEIAE